MNKFVIITSAVLNAVLLMVLFGILPFLLYLSIVINALFVWYSVGLIARSDEMEEDMRSILTMTESFADHVEDIHSLEMYYGDQDLQSMIEHSRSMINDMISMQEKYFEVEVTTEEEEDQDDQHADEAPPETQE